MPSLSNIFWLGTKELRTIGRDFVLLSLVTYAFTLAVYTKANSASQEFRNAPIAIADEDHSALSRRIKAALLPPYFKPPQTVVVSDIDRLMDTALYTFIVDIPPHFARDVDAGRRPSLQLDVDATAMMQAGIGAGYLEQIIGSEIARWSARTDKAADSPITFAVRVAFNPNLSTTLFDSIIEIINDVTMLAIILAGAAIVREREHGTMDHLLAMPLLPIEIVLAKVWANGLVIATFVGFSLTVVVQDVLRVPVRGSVPLFMIGVMLYLYFATAIGVFLGTIVHSMPQLGLLFLLIALPLNILSGGYTPLSSMPGWLQFIMQASPTAHFVNFAQSILYRGAGFDIVWPEFVTITSAGLIFFVLALLRFRAAAGAPIV